MRPRPLVLVVDDSLTVRMDLAEALEGVGFRVLPCATCADARRALAGEPIALAVLDVVLPDGDGISLLEELRAAPRTADVPVLILSSEAEVKDRVRGLKTGANDYVGKPYDTSYVIARARELVAGRQAPEPAGAPTILLIDDSRTFRQALAAALEEAGFAVVTAVNGEDGLRLAASVRPAAVIVDGVMPGIDGATVIRRLRLDQALRAIPCLVLTASEDGGAELRALDAGADAFVRKDEDAEVILARLKAVLRGASAERVAAAPSLASPKRILAVDADARHLHDLAGRLRDEGYDVVLARTGDEAIEILAVQAVDCILLDVGVAGQTCGRLKEAPATRHIPILLLSAREDRETVIGGLTEGADDFVAKGAGFEVLSARVRAQLRRKQIEDDHRLSADAETRAALEAVRVRDEFLSIASHELKTPITTLELQVEGALRLLRRAEADPTRLTDRLEMAAWQIVRLTQLINNLLDVSRITSGRLVLHRRESDLAAVVKSVLQRYREAIHRSGSEVRFEAGAAAIGHWDPIALESVVVNLVSNAAKFGEGKPISIRLDREGDCVRLVVADQGIGIAPEAQSLIFERFERAVSSRHYGGFGLGLWITRQTVEAHGGTIQVTSEAGRGSTFTVRLPV